MRGIVIVVMLSASVAHADDKATADRLFDEGRAAMAANDYASACPKLEESQRLDPALGTLLNIGLCYEGQGRLASALAVWREAEDQARGAGETKRATTAAEHIAALEPRVPTITVQVTSPSPGMQVTIGGKPVASSAWGQPAPADPGDVAITATAPDAEPFATTISVKERDRAVVVVPALAVIEKGGMPPAEMHPRRNIALLVGGGGLVVTAIGVVLAVGAKSDYNKAFDDGHCDRATLSCDDVGQAATDKARGRGTTATIVGALGLAAVAAGVVVYVTAPERSTAIVPTIDQTSAGVSLVGSF
ncbi:MAG TPA: hypothetical protein VL463_06970 [Kofleriaceae bacterium]|jgi:hypothetical protein|nr:hypothetical protein [Kofleriaceae bacterium]